MNGLELWAWENPEAMARLLPRASDDALEPVFAFLLLFALVLGWCAWLLPDEGKDTLGWRAWVEFPLFKGGVFGDSAPGGMGEDIWLRPARLVSGCANLSWNFLCR